MVEGSGLRVWCVGLGSTGLTSSNRTLGCGFGVRVWGFRMVLGFGVWGLGFGVWGLWFVVWGLGFGLCGLEFRV